MGISRRNSTTIGSFQGIPLTVTWQDEEIFDSYPIVSALFGPFETVVAEADLQVSNEMQELIFREWEKL